jgi:steroid delta-isomerase-like uncharacterized protein
MIDNNKELVRRFMAEVFDQGNLDVVDEIVAEDFVDHAAPPQQSAGREGVKQVASMFQQAFSGWRTDIEGMICEGDTVAFWGTGHGVHAGAFMGVEATGKEISIPGMHVVVLRDGKIAEHWSYNDQIGTMRQLGLIPGH